MKIARVVVRLHRRLHRRLHLRRQLDRLHLNPVRLVLDYQARQDLRVPLVRPARVLRALALARVLIHLDLVHLDLDLVRRRRIPQNPNRQVPIPVLVHPVLVHPVLSLRRRPADRLHLNLVHFRRQVHLYPAAVRDRVVICRATRIHSRSRFTLDASDGQRRYRWQEPEVSFQVLFKSELQSIL